MFSEPLSHVISRKRPFVFAAYFASSAIFAPDANTGAPMRRNVNFVGSYVTLPVAPMSRFPR